MSTEPRRYPRHLWQWNDRYWPRTWLIITPADDPPECGIIEFWNIGLRYYLHAKYNDSVVPRTWSATL